MRVLVLLFALVSAVDCHAVCSYVPATQQSVCSAPLKNVYMYSGSQLLFQSDSDVSPVACNLVSDVYWAIDKSDPRFADYQSALLTALAIGETVKVVTPHNNVGAPCQIGYIVFGD